MIFWSWVIAILAVLLVVGFIVLTFYIDDRLDLTTGSTLFLIFVAVLLLFGLYVGINALRVYVVLPWLETWDIGW